jgi:U3 small nucleolar RNA-associated protein 24
LRLAKDHALKNSLQLRSATPTTVSNMAETEWRCFIVATCDKELRGRIRRFQVPCMYVSGYRYTVERMPEAFGAPNTTMWCIDRSKSVDY